MEKISNGKTHYYYIIGFLVVLLVLVATYQWYEIKDLSSYISFAGTLISIILGVTAIIYAFISNSSVYNSIFKIDDASDKVAKISEDLKNNSDSLTKKIEELRDVIKALEDKTGKNTELLEKMASDRDKTLKNG